MPVAVAHREIKLKQNTEPVLEFFSLINPSTPTVAICVAAIKRPVPGRVVISDVRALCDAQG